MTSLTWTASRAFNHFVLRNVITDRVAIPDDKTLVNILLKKNFCTNKTGFAVLFDVFFESGCASPWGPTAVGNPS